MTEPEALEIAVWALRGTVNTAETILLPVGSKILRAGLNPGDQMRPAFWYTFPVINAADEVGYRIVVVTKGARLPINAIHIGMWWTAAETFHLFQLSDGGSEEADDIFLERFQKMEQHIDRLEASIEYLMELIG